MRDDVSLSGATDVHVHLMPDRLMEAIRGALTDQTGWAFPHPTDRPSVEAELHEHGVERYCALPYAHTADVAADLNDWVLARAEESSMCVPFATVHGDDDVNAVVREAFEAGARGLKFQCPVQEVAPDDPRLDPAFDLAAEYDRPVLFHAGTAPMFRDSPYVGVDRFRSFLDSYPDVRGCCAHMGAHEVDAFVRLAAEYDNAFLDTAYVLGPGATADMGPSVDIADDVFEECSGSIMFGSDYPNTTYPYSEGVRWLREADLSPGAREDIASGTARRFLGER